jgi:steroid delta-isomerase-like uncharacterized protein
MPKTMTAEEYKAKVRRSLEEVWNKSNWEVARETYADDIVVYSPSHPEPLHGREKGLRELHTALHTAHPDFHIEVHKMVCEGKDVAVRWTVSGTNTGVHFGMPPTGKKFASEEVALLRFNDEGMVDEIRFYMNVMEILQQLGVMPPGPPPKAMIMIIGLTQKIGDFFKRIGGVFKR